MTHGMQRQSNILQHALPNARHEQFAQAIVRGESAAAAYVSAGFRENRHNASALARQQHILTRIRELQGETAAMTTLTAASITERLLEIAESAKAEGGSSGLNVARQAYMDVAKINGLIIDKAEVAATVVNVVSAEPLSPDEWISKHGTASTH